jgi:glutamate-ammonia-ligase adenylyltransferase
VVSGDAGLAAKLTAEIAVSLRSPRDAAATRRDVLDMRRLMVKEQGATGLWDIKRARGGLVEVEFIAQYLQLVNASNHPAILDANTYAALSKLGAAGLLPAAIAAELREASLLYHRITQVLRLCVAGSYDPAASPAGLNQMVASAAILPDIKSAEALLSETQQRVAAIFDETIGPVNERRNFRPPTS